MRASMAALTFVFHVPSHPAAPLSPSMHTSAWKPCTTWGSETSTSPTIASGTDREDRGQGQELAGAVPNKHINQPKKKNCLKPLGGETNFTPGSERGRQREAKQRAGERQRGERHTEIDTDRMRQRQKDRRQAD